MDQPGSQQEADNILTLGPVQVGFNGRTIYRGLGKPLGAVQYLRAGHGGALAVPLLGL